MTSEQVKQKYLEKYGDEQTAFTKVCESLAELIDKYKALVKETELRKK